jgi:hypothetical protein
VIQGYYGDSTVDNPLYSYGRDRGLWDEKGNVDGVQVSSCSPRMDIAVDRGVSSKAPKHQSTRQGVIREQGGGTDVSPSLKLLVRDPR